VPSYALDHEGQGRQRGRGPVVSLAGRDGLTLVVLAGGRARRYGGCKPLAPVGPNGEAVLDFAVGDALAGGFDTVVLVVNPDTGPSIRYRVERAWPSGLDVRFAVQERPLGTVHAVLAAADHLIEGAPFAVANADDIYGVSALATLAEHLVTAADDNALVGFRLKNSVVSDAPVTRALCHTRDGWLASIHERRQVHPDGSGGFVSDDGLEPSRIDADELVSVNLWGFAPGMRKTLEATMAAAADVDEDREVLLPEMVEEIVEGRGPAGANGAPFAVLQTESRCIGVTHPGDLGLVQAELTRQVANGERAASPWEGASSPSTGRSTAG